MTDKEDTCSISVLMIQSIAIKYYKGFLSSLVLNFADCLGIVHIPGIIFLTESLFFLSLLHMS